MRWTALITYENLNNLSNNLKGHRIGGVEVSTKHAGFMVNVDQGTAKDYEDLIADVIAKVKENSGVTLEPEVRIIGDKLN